MYISDIATWVVIACGYGLSAIYALVIIEGASALPYMIFYELAWAFVFGSVTWYISEMIIEATEGWE